MDSNLSNPSLVPWGGVEARKSWVCSPESCWTKSMTRVGDSVGKPIQKEYLFGCPRHTTGMEKESDNKKERSGKRENSSRAQRGCGLDCGLNQLHKGCEKYKDLSNVVGTLVLRLFNFVERADESGTRHRTCPSCSLPIVGQRLAI